MKNPPQRSLNPSKRIQSRKSKSGNSRQSNCSNEKSRPVAGGGEEREEEEKEEAEEEKLIASQQRLLHCFRDAFYISGSNVYNNRNNEDNNKEALVEKIQKVKQHLYHREFDAAFGKAEFREVYALRWSAGRAIGYLRIFESVLGEELGLKLRAGVREKCDVGADGGEAGVCDVGGCSDGDGTGGKEGPKDGNLRKIVCLGGGGGAELVALAGLLARCASKEEDGHLMMEEQHQSSSVTDSSCDKSMRIDIKIVDIADWSSVIQQLYRTITSSQVLPAYASASKRAAAVATGPLVQATNLKVHFQQHDLLSNLDSSIMEADVREAWLVTIMFTMNELCHASFAKAHRLLSWLTAIARPGCQLLIVDSPGSYSSIRLKEGERKYPMRFYLDYALLGYKGLHRNDGEGPCLVAWKRLVSEESKWLRHSGRLEYPIQLEDMRVQIHLYERL